MELQLVNKKIAKQLKELGFDIPTEHAYIVYDEVFNNEILLEKYAFNKSEVPEHILKLRPDYDSIFNDNYSCNFNISKEFIIEQSPERYGNKNTLYYGHEFDKLNDDVQEYEYNIDIGDEYISAPTQALVCKWFRDVHDIIIIIDTRDCDDDKLYFQSMIEQPYENIYSDILDTYEQAEEAGIVNAIKLLNELINTTAKQRAEGHSKLERGY